MHGEALGMLIDEAEVLLEDNVLGGEGLMAGCEVGG